MFATPRHSASPPRTRWIKHTASLLLLSSTILTAQTRTCTFAREKIEGQIVLTARGCDPMETIVEQVRSQYHWLVSYEQPIFAPEHLVDVAVPEWRRAHPGEVGYLAPREQTLAVRFAVPAAGTVDEDRTLTAIVDQANAAHTFVHYGLVHGAGDRFTVFAEDAYSGTNGVAGATITVSDAPSPESELARVLAACSQASPMPFIAGTMDPNAHVPVVLKHTPETCRNAIERVTEGYGPGLIYELREDTSSKQIVVNIVRSDYRESSGDCPAGSKLGTSLPK